MDNERVSKIPETSWLECNPLEHDYTESSKPSPFLPENCYLVLYCRKCGKTLLHKRPTK